MIYKTIIEKCTTWTLGTAPKDTTTILEEVDRKMGVGFPPEISRLYGEIAGQSRGISGRVEFPYQATDENGSGVGSFDVIIGLAGHETWNLTTQLEWNAEGIGKGSIPLAANPGGDLLICSIENGTVASVGFWRHDERGKQGQGIGIGNMHLVCKSLGDLEKICKLPAPEEE